MPGLFGIFAKTPKLRQCELRQLGNRMALVMRHTPWLRCEAWSDDSLCAGRVHLGVLDPKTQPIEGNDGSRAWFDGEIFLAGAESRKTPTVETICRLLNDENELASTEGAFCLAHYDPAKQVLTLANDHCGLQPVYFAENQDWFAYASEVKALLAISDRLPALDEISLRQFFGYGHMLGERTWWKGIELLPPASVWRVSVEGVTRQRYWTFDQLRVDPRPEEDVIEEFGKVWSRAVRRRVLPGTMPLLLSGGIDSRMLLAELKDQGCDVKAMTFGAADSLDLKIAAQCARIAAVPHRSFVIDAQNWWDGREEAIWHTDGLVNGMHLHAVSARHAMHTGNWLTLKSTVGDAVFHGKDIDLQYRGDAWKADPRKLLSGRLRTNPFFSNDEVVEVSIPDTRNYLFGSAPVCYHYAQKTRRMTTYGGLALRSYCEVVLPRADMSLLQLFLGSVTEESRKDAKFFSRFLVQRYPRYFKNIPWEQTGHGLSETSSLRIQRNFMAASRSMTENVLRPISERVPGIWRLTASGRKRGIADYMGLLRTNQIREKLLSQDLLIDDCMRGEVRRHLKDASMRLDAHSLCAILTLENYLGQAAALPTVTDTFTAKPACQELAV